MTIKHKILVSYIKDLSVETPDPESLIAARENISKYSLKLDLSSKALKNKMIEVYTRLTYEDKLNKKKTYFEMIYATVVRIEEDKPKPEDLKKFILCDLQIQIYPAIEKTFLEILKLSGFPQLQLKSNVDFNKLYKEKNN
tara:strand:- start:1369 stop:1788 length:420 start_codon:yes stop_codon:yes gene_type:complete